MGFSPSDQSDLSAGARGAIHSIRINSLAIAEVTHERSGSVDRFDSEPKTTHSSWLIIAKIARLASASVANVWVSSRVLKVRSP